MISNRIASGGKKSVQTEALFQTENKPTDTTDHVTHRHDLFIEGHKLVALAFNPYAAGPPIILLHGICSSVHYWTKELVDPFIEQGPCYALSLPGHYPAVLSSQFQQEELNPVTIARLLSKAIRQLFGKQKVVLVGHSTGGFAALSIGAFVPDMTKFIVRRPALAQAKPTPL
ncbi:MAG: alpha/beta fold hydrolase, partial [Chloroflexota bacterium]